MSNKFKNILFEYSTLLEFLAIIFISKLFLYPGINNYIYVFAMFFIYFRHHHIGEQIVQERVSKHIIRTSSINGRKIFSLLDIPTFWVFMTFVSNWTNFYISAIVFVVWFILTDILRTRSTIYGQYISRWFYTSKININSKMWELHKADVDPFPSVPHMHAKNYPLKLNIYTGEIFDSRNKHLVSTASRKNLKKLWDDTKFIENVQNARKVYLIDHPKVKLPPIPTFE